MKSLLFYFALISFMFIYYLKARRDYRRLKDEKIEKQIDSDNNDVASSGE